MNNYWSSGYYNQFYFLSPYWDNAGAIPPAPVPTRRRQSSAGGGISPYDDYENLTNIIKDDTEILEILGIIIKVGAID